MGVEVQVRVGTAAQAGEAGAEVEAGVVVVDRPRSLSVASRPSLRQRGDVCSKSCMSLLCHSLPPPAG